jgi:predicted nucleotidyltransferase
MKKEIDNQIVSKISEIAARYPMVDRVGVFGSYARGEQNRESDIDIVYEYSPNKGDVYNTIEFQSELRASMLNNTDILSYGAIEGDDDYDFLNNVLRDVVWVYHV